MSRKPDQELLSAYLDGELTPQEKLHVEQWLSRDPEARRLLDRLRRQRELLASLPRSRCPRDLAPLVLETAERRILLEGAPSAVSQPVVSRGEQRSLKAALSVARRIFRPRNLGWAILAGSIGLAILLLYPQRHPREVGFHPTATPQSKPEQAGTPPASAKASAPELKAAPAAEGFAVDSARRRAAEPVRPEMAPAQTPQMGKAAPGTMAPTPQPGQTQSGGAIASAPGGGSAAPAAPLVIEGIRPVGPSDRANREQVAAATSPEESLTAEIRCRLSPDAPLQALVERLVARRGSIPDGAVTGSPWEFAGHLQRGAGSDQFVASGERSGLPPGTRLELTREDHQQLAVLEFSATEPQLKAILDELAGNRSWVKEVHLPQSLTTLAHSPARGTGKPAAPGTIPESESMTKSGKAVYGSQQRAVVPEARQLAAGVEGSQREGLRRQAPPAAAAAQVEGQPTSPSIEISKTQTKKYRIRLVLVRPIDNPQPAAGESATPKIGPADPQGSPTDSRPAQSSPTE